MNMNVNNVEKWALKIEKTIAHAFNSELKEGLRGLSPKVVLVCIILECFVTCLDDPIKPTFINTLFPVHCLHVILATILVFIMNFIFINIWKYGFNFIGILL